MIYFDFRKWIYLDISNPFKTMNKLKGVFIPLKCNFKWNIKYYNWFPLIWCSKPAFIHIMSVDVGWKDKFDTPRYEYPPAIWIHIWKMNLIWYWDLSNEKYMDDYWEMALWYLYYYSDYKMKTPDIIEAEKHWPWSDYKTKESTWNKKYIYLEI